MKKYVLILLCFIANNVNVLSQSISERKDSLKIDSIKRNLPSLKGTAHIDRMIVLCEYYSNLPDSARFYGTKILNESNPIGYKKAIAIGLLATAPDSLREKRARESIQIGQEIKNEEVLGWAYLVLSATVKDLKQNEAYQLQAIDHFTKAGKTLRAAYINTWLCQLYFSIGENEKAFDCARKNLENLKTIKSPEFLSVYQQSLLWSFWNMCEIFSAAGDYEEALKYIQKTDQVDKTDNPSSWGWDLDISTIHAELGRYDSALLYWQRYRNHPNWDDPNFGWRPGKKLAYNYLARIYTMDKQYEKAIDILKDNIVYFDSLLQFTTGNNQNAGNYGKMAASILLSRIYDTLKDYKTSLKYAKDGFYNAQIKNRRPEVMQACHLLSRAYHNLHNNDSAYSYLERYVTLKDSIQSKQFLLRIYNSRKEAENAMKESRIGFLNRDNQIKNQQLKQQATFRNFLIAAFIAIVFAGLYVFRNINLKRKNEHLKQQQAEQEWKMKQLASENTNVELQKQAAELEMQALRAQMNPHFIFNCLASINRFILKNESKIASGYLTRFSRLMRMVLMNSQKSLIALEDELQMLELYLEMERLRFRNSFDYGITFLNAIDRDNIFIPPLLLQPFCENAIWHGLMHLPEGRMGRLEVALSMENKVLHCSISDNGVGREKAEEMKSKSAEREKSMGLKITTERLALLNREKGLHTFYEIEDLKDENGEATGTRILLKISSTESVAEAV